MTNQRHAVLAMLMGAAAFVLAIGGEARADEPLLFVAAGPEGATVAVAAGAGHAGETLFLVVVGEGGHALESLDRGLVLDARSLDASGQAFGLLPEIEGLTGGGVDLDGYELRAIVMDDLGEFHVSTGVGLGAIGGAGDDDGYGLGGLGSLTRPDDVGGPPSPELNMAVLVPGPVGPIKPCLFVPVCAGGAQPDLIVSSLTLTTINSSTACTGSPLPFIGCPNDRFFLITAKIKNVGTCGIRCGKKIKVKWGMGLTPGSIVFEALNQTLTTEGLPPGKTMTFIRPYYMGPCGAPSPTFHLNYFSAIVDPTNMYAESNETNNQFTPPTQGCNFD